MLRNEGNIPAVVELEMVLPALYSLAYAPENCPGLQETSGFVRCYTESSPGLTGQLVQSRPSIYGSVVKYQLNLVRFFPLYNPTMLSAYASLGVCPPTTPPFLFIL